MNKKEATQVLAILKASYPNHFKDMKAEDAQGTISVWSMQFAELSAEIVLMALNKHISSSKYPPTIAEIKDKICSIYWEADRKAHPLYEMPDEEKPTKEEIRFYEQICRATEGYKYRDKTEPTIEQLCGVNQVKQLTEGDKR